MFPERIINIILQPSVSSPLREAAVTAEAKAPRADDRKYPTCLSSRYVLTISERISFANLLVLFNCSDLDDEGVAWILLADWGASGEETAGDRGDEADDDDDCKQEHAKEITSANRS